MWYRLRTLSGLLLAAAFAAGPALAQQGQQGSGPRAWISPTQGPTLTVVRLFAQDLPGQAKVSILAGPRPDMLLPIGTAETDAQGDLAIQFKVPAEAEIGEPYYFAVDPTGQSDAVLAQPPFEVIVRRDPAPGGA